VSARTARLVLDQHALASTIAGLAIFVLFATPSIKLYIYTEAINAVPVVLLVCSALLKPSCALSGTRGAVIVIGMLFFVVLFALGAYNSASVSVIDVTKYGILCLLCALLPLIADRKAVALAMILIAGWGLLLALIQLSHGVALSRDKGQTYLTLGYALGCSSLLGLLAASAARSWLLRAVALGCFVMSAAATATLLGRGPVLLPIVIFLIYLGTNTIFEPSAKKLGVRLLIAAVLLAPAIYYVWAVFSAERVFKRLELLSNIANEPRVSDTYLPALGAIAERPFGSGLEAAEQLIGIYPHNIFLEVWISGGVVALVLFGTLVGAFLRHIGTAAHSKTEWSTRFGFFLTLYYFAMWNISFGLSSAYALLPMMMYFASRTRSELLPQQWVRRLRVRTT
jgi:hypothetical protein